MLFVQSLRGLSHTKLEDTKPEHLELAVQALDRLARRRSPHALRSPAGASLSAVVGNADRAAGDRRSGSRAVCEAVTLKALVPQREPA